MDAQHIIFSHELLANHHNFVIAYSGGLDSHVLLHAMSELKTQRHDITLKAIHINHQLNPLADSWAAHCKKTCNHLQISLTIEKINIHLKPGDSLEEQARNARYEILKKYIDKNSVLLTAHNLNDQAETFLLQALRGAGPKGLSAMPVKKKFGESFLIRPLLHISRDEIEIYAKEKKLLWIEDDSNVNTKFSRNFLRQGIFPLLKERFPKCMQNFARSAKLMAEQESVIAEVSRADLEFCHTHTHTLSISALKKFSEPRQRLILREWFRENNLRMPNEKHLKQIQKDVINASPDAHPQFSLENFILIRRRGVLYLRERDDR